MTLRAMEPEDLDLLYEIENDRELWNVGATNVPYSRYALHTYIAQSQCNIYADEQVRLMIENAERKTVGIIDLTQFDPRNLRAELGIVVLNACRGKGYATAAVHKIIDYCRNILHLHQLYAYVATDNAESLALFTRLGFERGATLRDWLYSAGAYHDACLMQRFL